MPYSVLKHMYYITHTCNKTQYCCCDGRLNLAGYVTWRSLLPSAKGLFPSRGLSKRAREHYITYYLQTVGKDLWLFFSPKHTHIFRMLWSRTLERNARLLQGHTCRHGTVDVVLFLCHEGCGSINFHAEHGYKHYLDSKKDCGFGKWLPSAQLGNQQHELQLPVWI